MIHTIFWENVSDPFSFFRSFLLLYFWPLVLINEFGTQGAGEPKGKRRRQCLPWMTPLTWSRTWLFILATRKGRLLRARSFVRRRILWYLLKERKTFKYTLVPPNNRIFVAKSIAVYYILEERKCKKYHAFRRTTATTSSILAITNLILTEYPTDNEAIHQYEVIPKDTQPQTSKTRKYR